MSIAQVSLQILRYKYLTMRKFFAPPARTDVFGYIGSTNRGSRNLQTFRLNKRKPKLICFKNEYLNYFEKIRF